MNIFERLVSGYPKGDVSQQESPVASVLSRCRQAPMP